MAVVNLTLAEQKTLEGKSFIYSYTEQVFSAGEQFYLAIEVGAVGAWLRNLTVSAAGPGDLNWRAYAGGEVDSDGDVINGVSRNTGEPRVPDITVQASPTIIDEGQPLTNDYVEILGTDGFLSLSLIHISEPTRPY